MRHVIRPLLGAGLLGLVILTAGPAAANPDGTGEPMPPAVPAAPVPAPAPTRDPMGALVGLLGNATGQPLIPVVPGASPAADPLAAIGQLMPQNFGMPTGDLASPYALGQNTPSPFARIDAYQGVHALLHGALGRMPGNQLGQPLPGTAPPPGTAVPPGLVSNQPDPGAIAPEAPADPLPPGPPVPQPPVPQ